MKKEKQLTACIVTMNNSSCNFGNKLQNYAAKVILENLGLKVDTLAFQKQPNDMGLIVRIVLNTLSGYRFAPNNAGLKRSLKYYDFVKKNIPTKRIKSNLDRLSMQYDYFCIGSDQVWNPEWYDKVKKEIYLLTFAKPEQKICMAPSFGVAQLPDEWENWFSQQLRTFPHLAVREKSGVQIIEKLTGKKAMLMIDPTMMLSAEAWRNIARRPLVRKADRKYILTYFLGDKTLECHKQIQKIAKEKNYDILNLISRDEPELFSISPDEFLYLVDHAELICTDSFHACVFSILFDKPFLVYRRKDSYKDMFTRIEALLELLHLECRFPENVMKKDYFWHDYKASYGILQNERKKTMKYLNDCLNLERKKER